MGMIKLIFDDWCWRCEKCNSMMALPGIVPTLEMLKEKGWKYCPVCGKKIDFKATEAEKSDWVRQSKLRNKSELWNLKATIEEVEYGKY